MVTDRKDIDWFAAMVAIGGGVILGLTVGWAMDFGRDEGRWWLTAAILVAAVVVLRLVAHGLLRLRRQRAAQDPGSQDATQ